MTKSKAAPQPSLFRREVPQMPEGYYSSGPNPNLRRFVEEHATPYDPATDEYDVPPFNHSITSTKASAIYNMHTYWSKKPYDAIQQYIKHYTQPGDLVLDPFSGSGGTALAALLEGRAAIAIDLSPAATFITKNYCTPVDVDELERVYEHLKQKVKPEMDWLYETRCDRCDGRATTAYTVYSFVFQCPRCLTKIPLFDCPEVPAQTAAGKDKAIRICPNCYQKGHQEEISTSDHRYEPMPVLVSYQCDEGCKPQRDERRYNDANLKKREYFKKFDIAKLQEIESRDIPHWFPKQKMMDNDTNSEVWGVLYRPGSANPASVSDLYTKRNLWGLSAIFDAVNLITSEHLRYSLQFALTSMCLFVTIMHQDNSGTGGNITKGTYYIPPTFKDMNVVDSLDRKFGAITRGLGDITTNLDFTELLISTKDCTQLDDIPSNSIDYVFTDPPYSWKVQFGELNFIWEAWLKLNTRWHDQEIIVNDVRGKTDLDWANLMKKALDELYRVLKPGKWLSLCYHDTSEGTWSLVQDIIAESGFISDKMDSTIFIDTGQKAWKQIVADKVAKRDLVINFRKPREGEVAAKLLLTGEEDPATFNEKAGLILHDALEKTPGATGDRLYDELVSRMVRKGEFQRHNFDALLHSVAEENGGRWYLLETADQLDETESVKENAVFCKTGCRNSSTRLRKAPGGPHLMRKSARSRSACA